MATAPFAGVPYVLDGPAPVAPPFRLIDVATVLDIPDPHWANGAQLWGYPSGTPACFDPCSTGTFRQKETESNMPVPEFGAFTAYLPISCTPRSLNDQADFEARVTAAFNATESCPVETQLLTGNCLPLNPYVADDNLDVLSLDAHPAAVALGMLEDAIGDTCRNGLIHVTPQALTLLAESFEVIRTGGRLFTPRGTPVVVGDGYIGAFPDVIGTVGDGAAWMWATGPVVVARGPLITNPASLREATDRENNLITFYAERDYLVGWDTALQAAVLLDTEGCCGGGGGGGGEPATTAVTSQVADNAASVTLLSANSSRLGATIQNDSSATLYLKLGTTASLTDYTVQIPFLGYYEVPFNYTGRIDGIWATDPGNGAARITEVTP